MRHSTNYTSATPLNSLHPGVEKGPAAADSWRKIAITRIVPSQSGAIQKSGRPDSTPSPQCGIVFGKHAADDVGRKEGSPPEQKSRPAQGGRVSGAPHPCFDWVDIMLGPGQKVNAIFARPAVLTVVPSRV